MISESTLSIREKVSALQNPQEMDASTMLHHLTQATSEADQSGNS